MMTGRSWCWIGDSATLHEAALVTAELLRGIGARVDVQAMDFSTLTQRRTSRKPPEEGGVGIAVSPARPLAASPTRLRTILPGTVLTMLPVPAIQGSQNWYKLGRTKPQRCAPHDHRSVAAITT